MGGHDFTAALRGAVEDTHRVRVARSAVEEWKRTGGDVHLMGQERLTGRLTTLEFQFSFALGAMAPTIAAVLEHLTGLFTRCSPALRMDIQRQGVLLVGGGALLGCLRERLQEDLGLQVVLPEQPGRCLVRGLARLTRADAAREAAALKNRPPTCFPWRPDRGRDPPSHCLHPCPPQWGRRPFGRSGPSTEGWAVCPRGRHRPGARGSHGAGHWYNCA